MEWGSFPAVAIFTDVFIYFIFQEKLDKQLLDCIDNTVM